MQIDSIELFRVPLPATWPAVRRGARIDLRSLAKRRALGLGRSYAAHRAARIRRVVGRGVCLPARLAGAGSGRDNRSTPARQLQELLDPFQGNRAAKSALDIAWWNLSAGVRKKPLHRAAGRGSHRRSRWRQRWASCASTDELFAEIRAALEVGYQLLTLKFRPGWDVRNGARGAADVSLRANRHRLRRLQLAGPAGNVLSPRRLSS